jgi:hypothetical protein
MRRLVLCLAAAVAALVFVPAAFADGPVFVTQGGSGVATRDGAFHYVAVPYGTLGTVLEEIHFADRAVWWQMPLSDSWGTATIGNGAVAGQGLSHDGRTLVLEDTSGPFSPPSRFLVVDIKRRKVVRRITLPGSFSFDALSPNGSKMYLIQFTRTALYDPSHYVVREYDLRTNRLLPGKIAAREEDGNEPTMAGYAMTRTTSADGRWVYTLYQKPSGMPFIHALNTVAGVAHCIDLPWSKSNSGVYNLVLSLRNHDRTLAVNWRSGRPALTVAVGSWEVSEARSAFPWAWVGAGIGGGLAILAAAGAVLLLRRRRGQEVEERARHELGLA